MVVGYLGKDHAMTHLTEATFVDGGHQKLHTTKSSALRVFGGAKTHRGGEMGTVGIEQQKPEQEQTRQQRLEAWKQQPEHEQ
jgi:hypothetical protein